MIPLALSLTTTNAFAAKENRSDDAIPHSALSVSVGYVVERERGKDEESGSIGLEYEFRFAEKWGVGGKVEDIAGDVTRNISLVGLISFHPNGGWRLFSGPGYEFTDKEDEFLLRVGIGYEVRLGSNWTLAPEAVVDLIEGGKRTYSVGLALGFEF